MHRTHKLELSDKHFGLQTDVPTTRDNFFSIFKSIKILNRPRPKFNSPRRRLLSKSACVCARARHSDSDW